MEDNKTEVLKNIRFWLRILTIIAIIKLIAPIFLYLLASKINVPYYEFINSLPCL